MPQPDRLPAEPEPVGKSLEDVIARAAEATAAIATPEELAAYEAERERQLRHELLLASGIGDVLSETGMTAIVRDTAKVTRAVEIGRQWLASRFPVLVLLGPMGVGKTVAAGWGLARQAGNYVEAQELCRLRACRGEERAQYVRLLKCGLLVIDELGLEEGDAAAMLQDVVNGRQRKPRRTMVLSNLTREVFEARYDERTIDRLREVGVFRSVGVNTQSMRRIGEAR